MCSDEDHGSDIGFPDLPNETVNASLAMPESSSIMNEREIEILEGGDEAMSFEIELISGDRKSGFHTQNDPDEPFQRANVVQRKGAVDVKCTLVDTVHGFWGPEEPGINATLLVLLFRFDSRKRSRRVAWANLEFAFFDAQNRNRKNPEVAFISFDDSFSLVPTQRHTSTGIAVEGTAGGGVPGAEISGTLKWERCLEEDTTDATHITGSIDRLGTRVGPSNAATWTLMENNTTKKGVPTAMRVGIILRRVIDDDFYCTVKVETEVDLKTGIQQLFGSREPDDPINFRVQLPPTQRLMKYDSENLGSFNLSTIEDVTVTVLKDGAVKNK